MGMFDLFTCPVCNGSGKCQDPFHSGVNPFTDEEGHPDLLDHIFGSCPTCGGTNTEMPDGDCPNCDGTGSVSG